jgi:hypothetical protein
MATMRATTLFKGWEWRSAGSAEIARRSEAPVPRSRVFQRLREILGYDVREQSLLAEGYREFAEESLALSESTLAAGVEALPPEEPQE